MTPENSSVPGDRSPPSDRGPAPDPQDFSRSPETALFAHLDAHALAFTNVSHEPTHTVADSRKIKTNMPGGHTKSLFMKDKKNNLVLVSAWANSQLPLNQLHKAIGTQRLSFTNPGLLWDALGVTPGSVTAFALINDPDNRIRFILDHALMQFDTVNFHPLRNDMTTSITQADFIKFLASLGREPEVIDFTQFTSPPMAQ